MKENEITHLLNVAAGEKIGINFDPNDAQGIVYHGFHLKDTIDSDLNSAHATELMKAVDKLDELASKVSFELRGRPNFC